MNDRTNEPAAAHKRMDLHTAAADKIATTINALLLLLLSSFYGEVERFF